MYSFMSPDQLRVQIVDMIFPDADNELGGRVKGRPLFRNDIEDEPFSGHLVEPCSRFGSRPIGPAADHPRFFGDEGQVCGKRRLFRVSV
jgi:hypothetical protein